MTVKVMCVEVTWKADSVMYGFKVIDSGMAVFVTTPPPTNEVLKPIWWVGTTYEFNLGTA